MAALSLIMRPTENGWTVCLTNGQELIRYCGFCSKQLALRYLQRYARSMPTAVRTSVEGLITTTSTRKGKPT